VAITGNSSGTTASQLVAYTTTSAYYSVAFTADFNDSSFTITLGGSSPGSASAQSVGSVYTTDWSMANGTVYTSLEGQLVLLTESVLTAQVVNAKTVQASVVDMYSNGPTGSYLQTDSGVVCNFLGKVNVGGRLAGATGTFTTLYASGTGTFDNGISTTAISSGDVYANSVYSTAVTAKSSGFLATNGGGFNVFSGGGVYPFKANGSGAVTCTSITSGGGTGTFGPVGASQLAVSGAITCTGTGSFGTVAAPIINCSGTGSFGNISTSGTVQASNITLNSVPLFNPAYMRAVLSSSGVSASVTVNLSWIVGNSSNITLNSSPGFRFIVADAGIYVFSGKLNSNMAITSTKVAILRTSSDGGVNWNVLQQWQCGSAPANSDFVLSGYLINATVANTSYSVQFTNDTASTFTFNNNYLYSHLSIWRIA
jgi:hypothetical protein